MLIRSKQGSDIVIENGNAMRVINFRERSDITIQIDFLKLIRRNQFDLKKIISAMERY